MLPVDLCGSTNGRLVIEPGGTVIVQAENNDFGNAQCFTSLDGASFALNANGFTPLTLINRWTNAASFTSNAAVKIINGLVHFKGAIANGTNDQPFVMPAGFRPLTDVLVNVDLCNSTKGRLHIFSSGTVFIEAENGAFSNAQCFTSLDGAFFAPANTGFQPLSLINAWTNAPDFTTSAKVTSAYGIVSFKGVIAGGKNAFPFTLPPAFSPVTDVYIPLDLSFAHKGRLHIQPSGVVDIEEEGGGLFNANAFTSLEGVSFV